MAAYKRRKVQSKLIRSTARIDLRIAPPDRVVGSLVAFRRPERAPVLSEGLQMDNDIFDGLPELFAATHRLSRSEVGGELFAVCACGFVQKVCGEEMPSMCSLHAAVEIFRSEAAWRYRQTVERTMAAGLRDEREHAALRGASH